MRGSHVAVALVLAGWMCCPLGSVRPTERIVYVPTSSFGFERARPTNIGTVQTIDERFNFMDAVGLLSRYSGKAQSLLYPPREGEPTTLYIMPEGSATYDVYQLPHWQCCTDPDRPAVAKR